MRLLAKVSSSLALWVLPIVGCNDLIYEVPTAPQGQICREGNGGSQPEEPLEGVWVCETDTMNCAPSDANGEVTIQLPVGLEISYTLEKEGYPSYLYPEIMPPDGFRGSKRWLDTNTFVAGQHDRVGSPYPMRFTGTISIATVPNAVAGVTFELMDATGNAFYSDEEGLWSAELAATTSRGYGGFTEVTPGDYQVKLGGSAANRCIAELAWPTEYEDIIKLPVLEGYITIASVRCAATPP